MTKKSKPSIPKKPSSKPAPKLPGELTPPQALDHFRAAALAFKGTIKPCTADTAIALANVRTGLESIRPHVAEIPARLPEIDLVAVFDVVNIAIALQFVATQVPSRPQSDKEVKKIFAETQKLRVPFLLVLEGLARLGHLPLAPVLKLKRGRGLIDAGSDAVGIDKLLDDHAKVLKIDHLFKAQRATLASHGNWILANVKPSGARTPRRAAQAAGGDSPSELRDRLWALLQERHKDLRRIGHVFFNDEDEVNERIPLLRSRERTRKTSSETPKKGAPKRAKKSAPPPSDKRDGGGPETK